MSEDRTQLITTSKTVYEIFFDFKFTTLRESWSSFVEESNEYHNMLQEFILFTNGVTDWHISTEYLVSVDTEQNVTKEVILKDIKEFLEAFPHYKKKVKDVSITKRIEQTEKEWVGKILL